MLQKVALSGDGHLMLSFIFQVFSHIQNLSQLGISKHVIRIVPITDSNLVAFMISFTLKVKTAPTNIVNRVQSALIQALSIINIPVDINHNFGVLAFQPNGEIMLQLIYIYAYGIIQLEQVNCIRNVSLTINITLSYHSKETAVLQISYPLLWNAITSCQHTHTVKCADNSLGHSKTYFCLFPLKNNHSL